MKCFLLLIVCWISLSAKAQSDIILTDPTGRMQTLAACKGKLILVDFWASWCTPCRKAHPGLVKLYNKFKNSGFEIFSVSLDEDKNAWRKAIVQDGLRWIQVNEAGTDGPVATAWNIVQVPSSYLLDRSGKVIAKDLSVSALETKILQLLNKHP